MEPLERDEIQEAALRGVDACRRGQWEDGLRNLALAAQSAGGRKDLPGVYYSYLGYCIARFENRRREGVALCKHAIKVEFYRGENYFNLARTYLVIDNRIGAVRALREGLAVDPDNKAMQYMLVELGVRRNPVLPFLDRSHPINRFLGRVRHRLTSS